MEIDASAAAPMTEAISATPALREMDKQRLIEVLVSATSPERQATKAGNLVTSSSAFRYLKWTSNYLQSSPVENWSFLTNHARALIFISREPDARLRDLAAALDITERTAFGIVADLSDAGYVVKEKDGRRNRYHIQSHLPLRDSISRTRTIGDVLDLLGAERGRGPDRAGKG